MSRLAPVSGPEATGSTRSGAGLSAIASISERQPSRAWSALSPRRAARAGARLSWPVQRRHSPGTSARWRGPQYRAGAARDRTAPDREGNGTRGVVSSRRRIDWRYHVVLTSYHRRPAFAERPALRFRAQSPTHSWHVRIRGRSARRLRGQRTCRMGASQISAPPAGRAQAPTRSSPGIPGQPRHRHTCLRNSQPSAVTAGTLGATCKRGCAASRNVPRAGGTVGDLRGPRGRPRCSGERIGCSR